MEKLSFSYSLFFYYVCFRMMFIRSMKYAVKTYYHKEELPLLGETTFFHDYSSFDWYSHSPTYTPLMLVAFNGEKPVAALFANITRINRIFRGTLFKRCFVSQQPTFFDDSCSRSTFFTLITHLVGGGEGVPDSLREPGRRHLWLQGFVRTSSTHKMDQRP